MAVVKGPLFSIAASGTVAGAVVYSTWKGRPYVRQHAVPANPKSVLQVSVRSVMRYLSQQWENLSAANQTTWDTRAAVTNISPFNAYCACNLERWGRYRAPCKEDPATEAGAIGVWEASTATAQVKSVAFAFKMSNERQNWGLVLYQGSVLTFTPDRSNAIRLLRHEDTNEMTFTLTGLTTGQDYYFNIAYFSDFGQLGAPIIQMGPATPA